MPHSSYNLPACHTIWNSNKDLLIQHALFNITGMQQGTLYVQYE